MINITGAPSNSSDRNSKICTIRDSVNKFTTLKKWLTVPDVAKRFSNFFDEDITEADVLQQALDGHFKISINIVRPVKVRRTKVVAWDGTEWLMFPRMMNKNPLPPEQTLGNAKCPPILEALWKRIPEDERKMFMPVLLGRRIDDERFLILDQQITEISGIFDLPMIGDERLDVEYQYHLLTGGAVVGLQSMGDAYVEDENRVICQLQVHRNLSERLTESQIHLCKLKEHISNKKIKRPEAQRLFTDHLNKYENEYFQEREEELNKIFPSTDKLDDYEPANTFPEDSVFVVRSAALREFERLMTEAPSSNETCPRADTHPRSHGHLNHDLQMQQRANEIAAELREKSSTKIAPTRGRVARILAEELGKGQTSVLRRIRLQW